MKKIFYFMLTACVLMNISCEKDFLDVQAPSSVDNDFVFGSPEEATKVLAGLYDIWHDLDKNLYYDVMSVGSDSEHHPEPYSAQSRHIPMGLFPVPYNINDGNALNTWNEGYQIINKANSIIEAVEGKAEFQDAVAAGTPNAWTQLYGEALCHRATNYKLLISYFGDVPYFDYPVRTQAQTDTLGYTVRDKIYDKEIAALKKIAPLMYPLGGNLTAERFSGTYAYYLTGRLAFDAAGYQLRRTDFDYGSISFDQWGQENSTWNAKYVRNSNWQSYMQTAKEYFLKTVNNSGTAHLIETDGRGAKFDNPFQRNFQYLLDLEVSPESLFEAGYTRTQNSDWPYSWGRPSGGAGSNDHPNKCYGQGRINPYYVYGDFDPSDKRRDVTACFTGNTGKAGEILMSWARGNREKGGFCTNKFDEARMSDPYIPRQRQSGVNWQQVRMGEVMLDLAYAAAATGDEATAKTYFKKVRARAFSAADQATKVNAYVDGMSGQALLDGIEQELKLETGGEGKRRWDTILFGTFPKHIQEMRDNMRAMIAGLAADGYYTFPNGVQISNYIFTKKVKIKDVDPTLDLLTYQTPAGLNESDPRYPVLVPGWRGTNNGWADYLATLSPVLQNNHIAQRGMFRYIDPASAEGLALLADGYQLSDWGINLVKNAAEYTDNFFLGYPDGSYAAGVPPRYIMPIAYVVLSTSNGLLTQGYGHASE
ncbi:RagB/SusD family nutrient uptake outer membrane protein [Mariniflexile sp. HNIBRBA6329]|uniref:RagB/SusD family nutrient uptake outer membrane protein n=1 Tax=Mariniflexile sp. HNIBRBA6329 TaxID=3373088 RepID=UPI003744D3DA